MNTIDYLTEAIVNGVVSRVCQVDSSPEEMRQVEEVKEGPVWKKEGHQQHVYQPHCRSPTPPQPHVQAYQQQQQQQTTTVPQEQDNGNLQQPRQPKDNQNKEFSERAAPVAYKEKVHSAGPWKTLTASNGHKWNRPFQGRGRFGPYQPYHR